MAIETTSFPGGPREAQEARVTISPTQASVTPPVLMAAHSGPWRPPLGLWRDELLPRSDHNSWSRGMAGPAGPGGGSFSLCWLRLRQPLADSIFLSCSLSPTPHPFCPL